MEEAATGVLRLSRALAQEERVLLRVRRRRELVQQRPPAFRRARQVSCEFTPLSCDFSSTKDQLFLCFYFYLSPNPFDDAFVRKL